MNTNSKLPKRRLKKQFRGNELAKAKFQIARLQRRVEELEEKLSGGHMTPDGEYCDLIFAARYLGKSKQTLRNWRSEGTGPKSYTKSGSVWYRFSDLKLFIEKGVGARHEADG